jgi:3-methyladenine DNA glycosylase/8-oxoguanine DNA glycosylase
MDYEKLIERLNNYLQSLAAYSDPELAHTLEDAATTLSTLQAENKRLKSLLGESGQDLWSKENQRADRLEAENEKLRAEVKMWKCRCKEIVSHASELDMDLQNAEKENAELLASSFSASVESINSAISFCCAAVSGSWPGTVLIVSSTTS